MYLINLLRICMASLFRKGRDTHYYYCQSSIPLTHTLERFSQELWGDVVSTGYLSDLNRSDLMPVALYMKLRGEWDSYSYSGLSNPEWDECINTLIRFIEEEPDLNGMARFSSLEEQFQWGGRFTTIPCWVEAAGNVYWASGGWTARSPWREMVAFTENEIVLHVDRWARGGYEHLYTLRSTLSEEDSIVSLSLFKADSDLGIERLVKKVARRTQLALIGSQRLAGNDNSFQIVDNIEILLEGNIARGEWVKLG